MAWTQQELKRFSNSIRRHLEASEREAIVVAPGFRMPNVTLNQFEKLKTFLLDIPFCHPIAITSNAGRGGKRQIDVILVAKNDGDAIWQAIKKWTSQNQISAFEATENEDMSEDEREYKAQFIEVMADIRGHAKAAIEAHYKVKITASKPQ
jgi:hypothetical protein